MYRKVDDRLLDRLEKELGKGVIFSSEEVLEAYSRDETRGIEAYPEAVVKARDVNQVQRVVQLANESRIPITPRGLGHGLSGGAVPVHGGIVISMERMDQPLELDLDNLMATVEPGIITGNFHRHVENQGLFYPPDPASLDSCSLGGNIAEGAGGPHAVKYGSTKDYVCGLEVVLPTGEIIRTGGKVVKDATGYNLTQFFIGSEGTLGIITKAILRLIPLPQARADLLVAYSSVHSASKTVSELVKSRVIPAALELMDNASLELGKGFLGREPPFPNAAAHLLITLHGSEKRDVGGEMKTIEEICSKNGAIDILVSHSSASRERLWKFRRCLFEAAPAKSSLYRSLDPVVPRARMPDLIVEINRLADSTGFEAACFGHAGDGNIHVVMFPGKYDEEAWLRKYHDICEIVFKKTLALGGKIAAEHGIGVIRKAYLPMAIEPAQLNLMKRAKRAFDPRNIMNPGKIFDL
ncbi:MAG: FAD-linked oxidase C-terminal domain-containing protein [Anaerolineae bacterium]